MVAEGHGKLNKHKSMPTLTSTSTPNLKGKATSGNTSSSPMGNGNFGSTREKYLSLQRKFEELTAIQTKNKALFKDASLKLKSLQDECDMLIDSIAPNVSTQPSLLHVLECMSREGSHGGDSSLRAGPGGARGSGGR